MKRKILKKIDHIGIVVLNLDASLRKFKKLFNVDAKIIETLEKQNVRMAFIPIGDVMLELVEPIVPDRGNIGEFLKRNGEGFHHIAYRVEKLDELLESMNRADIALIDNEPRPGAAGSRIVFLAPDETNNVLTELVERKQDL